MCEIFYILNYMYWILNWCTRYIMSIILTVFGHIILRIYPLKARAHLTGANIQNWTKRWGYYFMWIFTAQSAGNFYNDKCLCSSLFILSWIILTYLRTLTILFTSQFLLLNWLYYLTHVTYYVHHNVTWTKGGTVVQYYFESVNCRHVK